MGGLSFLTFCILMAPNFNRAYGYFIDEFYYLACARRLAFGYVDHPFLAPLLLRISSSLLGTSIPAIRFLPAVAISSVVFLTGLFARRLGGGTYAQTLAALAAMSGSVVLIMGGLFTVNAFEILFWVTAVYVLLRILQTDDSRLWVVFGAVAGLGLETKHTTVLLGFALVVGLLLVPQRRYLRDKWFWLGGLITFAIFLPNLIWQYANGWPSLEFYRNAEIYKNVPTPPVRAFATQILFNNPATLPVWLAGLVYFLYAKDGRRYRLFGLAYLVLLAIILLARSSRPDRIGGAYPMLFAGGAVWLERLIAKWNVNWLKPALASLIILGGVTFAPLCLPILPPDITARYSQMLGVVPQLERGKTSPLPQWLADRFDWEVMLKMTSAVFHALPPDEQRECAIAVPDYGHAGAIELLGPEYGLPRVICAHNNYFLWGMNETTPQVLIAIGTSRRDLEKLYEDIRYAGTIPGTYCMSWRRDMDIVVARKPKLDLRKIWRDCKHFE